MQRKRKFTDQISATDVVAPIYDLYSSPIVDESIRKTEYRTHPPFVKAFDNSDIIELTVNQVDAFFHMKHGQIIIDGKLEKKGAGDVFLGQNFGAFLFDSCTYSLNAKEIETVRDPGIVSTVRALTCYGPEDNRHMCIAGWNYPSSPIPVAHDNSFRLIIPLTHIFNIFNDYHAITCGRQTIRLVRSRNDNDCLVVKEKTGTNATTGTTGKIVINNIVLKVPYVYPNDEIKEKLLRAINSNRPIIIPFRKWELNELPAITANSRRDIWAVKTSTAVEKPRYVIVFFQTEKRDNFKEDATTFSHINISCIRLCLNGEYYPSERPNLDWANGNYHEALFDYSNFYPSYSNSSTKHPLLDFTTFKKYPLFVIDCSKQEQTMKTSTVDVRLDIESNAGFPENTKAYCIIIHDSMMEHYPLTEVVKSLT